jgi:hypothetical protein
MQCRNKALEVSERGTEKGRLPGNLRIEEQFGCEFLGFLIVSYN